MRLIDADKLIDYFYYGINERPVIDGYNDRKIIDIIKEQPTAYDVDKVVERLRKEISDCMCDECDRHTDCDTCRAEKAVEIVKSGGGIE